MTDFDTVLERLLTDPAFPAALAADPGRALAGYQLDAGEVEILRSQVSFGDGGGRAVETRTSKANLFGLLAPLHGGGGAIGGGGTAGGGPAEAGGAGAFASGHDVPAVGESAEHVTGGSFAPEQLTPGHPAGGLPAPGELAAADHPAAEQMAVGSRLDVPASESPAAGYGYAGEAAMPGGGDQVATDYHAHVDADGDGHWDHYVAVRHADGSVDVYEDRNGDGRIDFIGHDRNGDGILESADYDNNFDGVTDVHMTDTNGDGWMDTRSHP